MMKIFSRISLAVLAAMLLLAGCGTTGQVEEGAGGAGTATTAQAGEGAMATPAERPGAGEAMPMEGEGKEAAKDPFTDPNSMLSKRIVYFDFDSSTISDDAVPLIKAHGEYLASNSGSTVTLEGHADERGTREYNIALGERRADAVRRMLIAEGVASNQINVISYGEERPARMGHNEAAWQYNRRVVLNYPGK
jgi:peptidoglycan-associated lipoprotein